MNIYLHELKDNRKFVLTWLFIILGILFFLSVFYPVFNKEMENFLNIINNMPAQIRVAFGMNPTTIGSILGYYAFMLTLIFICSAIEAMILGLSILSKEIRERTADFLLSKPVSRLQIVVSKLLACITLIIISNVIYFIGFYLILLAFTNTEFAFDTYILLTLTILFIQLIFFSLGSLISVLMPKVKGVVSISLGVVFGFYLLSTFTEESLRILMPFKYFDLAKILLTTSYELKYVLLSSIVVVFSLALTYVIYKKKDIHAVV